MLVLLFITAFIILAYILFLQLPQFGSMPSGERLQRIQASPNYRDGQFQNFSPTPQLTEGATFPSLLKEFFFNSNKNRKPPRPLPSKKIDLCSLDPGANVIVWFGHSSYFLQVDGRKILVDPVFSGNASPLPGTTRSFPGSDVYTVADMPHIDYLFITHDHWDHLDYKTVEALRPKVSFVVTTLGTGAHLGRWGYDTAMIKEGDWNSEFVLGNGFRVNVTPGRHFAGRTFKRNSSLWASFVLTTPTLRLFLGGDSGYDTHFADIGNKYGPFDLAILETGQYNKSWKHIHMMPEETVQAAIDLKAKRLLPVHWAKFTLATHNWDDPITRVTAEAHRKNIPLLHPIIGEPMSITDPGTQSTWWTNF